MYLQEMMSEMELLYNSEELKQISKLLNKNYNLYLSDAQLWKMVSNTFGETINPTLDKYKEKYLANEFINAFLLKYFTGERIIKYHFMNNFINSSNEIVLFEMNADDSRVDFCRVNGSSYAYEIKTELDNLNRLTKQIEDYSKVFEYVYVITYDGYVNKVKDILPSHCGIIIYKKTNQEYSFINDRKAKKSPFLDPLAQIRNLSSDDIKFLLNKMKVKSIPAKRLERESIILKYKPVTINRLFKLAVKNKFYRQWSFIQSNFKEILPIDIQVFFHQPISPSLAYYKDSSIV